MVDHNYGGCSILYRKSLSSCIVPLDSCSDRFCGVKFCDSSGLSFLLVSVYMPSVSTPSSNSNYLNVLGELEGLLIHSAVMLISLLVILMSTLTEVEEEEEIDEECAV